MNVTESQIFFGATATVGPFTLKGGIYVVSFVRGGSQTVKLQLRVNATFVDVMTALSASGISPALYLPAGQYQIVLSTSDASDVVVASVPV